MNKSQAKKIVQSGITVTQIKEMLTSAYRDGAANESRSTVNKGASKSVVFNILWKGYENQDVEIPKHGIEVLGAVNALREFGDFWEGETPVIHRKKETVDIYREDVLDPFGAI